MDFEDGNPEKEKILKLFYFCIQTFIAWLITLQNSRVYRAD